MLICQGILQNQLQWSSYKRGVLNYGKKPHLVLEISVKSSKLNTPKLSKKQVSLYEKICDLRFDENLTWKQVADRLNNLGFFSTRGRINTSSTVCSTYFKIRKHFERKNRFIPPNIDDVELVWE